MADTDRQDRPVPIRDATESVTRTAAAFERVTEHVEEIIGGDFRDALRVFA